MRIPKALKRHWFKPSDWCRDIPEHRKCGHTRCIEVPLDAGGLNAALEAFQLPPKPEALIEVSVKRAQEILALLLWKDLAYGGEIMPQKTAQKLAQDFVSTGETHEALFFSNADWPAHLRRPTSYPFTGLTNATFDGGVIALGKTVASCVWIEDED
jgi:hypothetical protein